MKLFGTDGIRGKHGVHPITESFAEKIGRAAASSLPRLSKIVVCRDTRHSGKSLERGLVKGIKMSGGVPVLIGVLPSNAVSFAVQREKAGAGIMISASHNPFRENGFKFFNRKGFKFFDKEEREVERVLKSGKFRDSVQKREVRLYPYKAYERFLEKSCPAGGLKGLRVVVDAGNGSASGIASGVFRRLGAEVKVINSSPDGFNINRGCGSTSPRVLQKQAREFDAGVAFDGDADRIVVADEKGRLVDGDKIIGLMSVYLSRHSRLKKRTVVLNNYSNKGLQSYLRSHKIKVSKVKVGDKFVSKKLFEDGLSIGGEPSGHVIVSSLSKTSDAVLTAIAVLGALKEAKASMSELVSDIKLLPQLIVNVDVREKKDIRKLKRLNARLEKAKQDLRGEGRVFIRYSGTENKMRILAEGRDESSVRKHAEMLVKTARSEIGK